MSFNPVGIDAENLQKFERLSAERKALQAAGLLPQWYTTAGWQMFKDGYMVEGEKDVWGRHRTIAKTLARHMKGREAEWEQKFFDLLWEGRLSPASPALGNTGTKRGMTVSCSGQVVGDSVDSYYTNLRRTALLSQNGFGTSADFSSIRPRGSKISRGGKANGAVPVMEQFFDTAGKIRQGRRRGAVACYLDIEHGDWDEAADGLLNSPNGKNYGWTIRDSFVEKLKAGDADAHRRFSKALYIKLVTGKGYFFCVDKANRHRPQMYKDLGLDVVAANLCCVAADQRVVTDKGLLTVGELYKDGTPNTVVGLTGTSKASKMLLPRPNAPMVQIETAEGYRHKVTPDHRVWKKGHGWIEAQELVPGDKLLIQQGEGIFGPVHNPDLALLAGFVAGDGTFNETSVCVDLWEQKTGHMESELQAAAHRLLADNLVLRTTSTNEPSFAGEGKRRLSSAPLKRTLEAEGFTAETKTRVPEFVWRGDRETVGQYLRGLYVTDGSLQASGGICTVSLASVDKEHLHEIQILWANFGVKSTLCKLHDGGLRDFGDRGGVCETRPIWRLLVTSIQGCRIVDQVTGLSRERKGEVCEMFKVRLERPGYAQKLYATFTGLTDLPNEDAYCLTVDSETHAWTVNGMVTHNTEIMLHSSEDYNYSCILASLNLVHADQFMQLDDTTIFDSTVFLDCLCSEFIEQSAGIPGLEKVRAFTLMGRAVGLGVMGLHTYFQMKGIPYISLEAQFFDNALFKRIHDETLRASQWLAKEYGEPEWCKGYGVRNTHRTALAPTKSTSLLMGGVSESWMPEPGMVFDAGSAVGELRRITPVIYELMKERGVYSEATIQDIIEHMGSVQHVDWLDDHEKLVFLTAFEMDQEILLRRASLRQKWLCQGQSLNFFVPEDGCEEKVAKLMTKVLCDENIFSQYYVYSRSGVVVKDECVACAG